MASQKGSASSDKDEGEREGDKDKEKEKEKEKQRDLGQWDVELCASKSGFEFSKDRHTAALKQEFAGQWCAVVGDRHFENGLHSFAMRVSYHGSSSCPSSELDNGWVVGVGPKHAPLDIGSGLEENEDHTWARGHPAGYMNRWYVGISNASGHEGRVVLHPSSLLKHGSNTGSFVGHVYHNDTVGVKFEVEHGKVSFYVNGAKRKEVSIQPPSSCWVPWVCSCTPRVSFTLLGKEEQQKLKIWSQAERKELEGALAHGASAKERGERVAEEERMQALLLAGEGKEEVLEMIIAGVELPHTWFQGHELDEVWAAASLLRSLLLAPSPIAPAALKHHGNVGSGQGVVLEAMAAGEEEQAARGFLLAADTALHHARRRVERAESALQGLRAGEEAYEEQAAMDMSLTLSTQAEQRRLMSAVAEAEAALGEALGEREGRRGAYRAAKARGRTAGAAVAALHNRSLNALFRLYVGVAGHVVDNTAARPTFSAPSPHYAHKARERRARGFAVGPNELLPAKVDPATGNITLTAASRTGGARICYTLDGTPPHHKDSPSIASGRKITLSKSTRIMAMATAPGMRPSPIVTSPLFAVACAPPAFIAQSVGNDKIRVQLRSGTTGQVKIYYAFNSRESTPMEAALQGGNPQKEPPYGDGIGRRDGSQPLRTDTGQVQLNRLCAGVTNNFDFIDVVTSGHVSAFAAKEGLADSEVVRSSLFTVVGK